LHSAVGGAFMAQTSITAGTVIALIRYLPR